MRRKVVGTDPEHPGLDALEPQNPVDPEVIGEQRTRLVLAARPHDEHDMLAVNVAYRPSEQDLAFIVELVDEPGMLGSALLLASTPRRVPAWSPRLPDEEVALPLSLEPSTSLPPVAMPATASYGYTLV